MTILQRSISFLIVSFVFVCSVVAQTADTEKGYLRPVEKIVKWAGWQIPNTLPEPRRKEETVEIDGVPLIVRFPTPDPAVIDFEDVYAASDKEVKIATFTYEVSNMTSYEINGKTFAYLVTYQHVTISDNEMVITRGDKEERVPIRSTYRGSIHRYYFLDRDGDGKFEERIRGPKSIEVPLWVKNWLIPQNSPKKI